MSYLEENMVAFVKIGTIPGVPGVNRTFGSSEYQKAAEALKVAFADLGLDSYIDSVGNVHGIFRAEHGDGEEILIGSHLDTVREGGIFDGLLGIVGGMECISRLRAENRKISKNIHLIATNGEEGNALGGTFGSRALVGKVDTDSEVFRTKAPQFGFTEQAVRDAQMDFGKSAGYLELHIEQGCALEQQRLDIGVVTGIVGLERYKIVITGQQNHAGTTRMEYRKDALVAMSKLIVETDEATRRYPNHFVATFQTFEVSPNTLAVINGKAETVLEIRNQSAETMAEFMKEVQAKLNELEREMQVTCTIVPIVKKAPVLTDANLTAQAEAACRESGVSYCRMPSGATHDGNMMALKTPIAMIFVPSKDGISHSPLEWTDYEQCEKGADVLYRTVLRLAGVNEG